MNKGLKILGVILTLYAIIAGMLIPMSPATNAVEGGQGSTGERLNITVQGYNTYYQSAENIRVWLRRDTSFSICASDIQATSDRKMTVAFDIPERVINADSITPFSVVVDAPKYGYSVLPNAVSIAQKPTAASLAADCEIGRLSEREMGITFPFRSIIEESIRCLYYHVPLWFAMMLLMGISVYYSIQYLNKSELKYSVIAAAYARVGVLFGILGLVTGAIWAKHTWGAYWSWDVKQNMAAIAVLVYMAYFVVRDSFDDLDKQARISAVYNIFAFAALIPLLFVIPRMADSLHPGNGGNPAFGSNDLDNTMRLVFYPAVIGMMLLGAWMSNLSWRINWLKLRKELDDL